MQILSQGNMIFNHHFMMTSLHLAIYSPRSPKGKMLSIKEKYSNEKINVQGPLKRVPKDDL